MIQGYYLVVIMKIETNYHTHTYLCKHAEGTASDYVKYAKAHGYKEIAITDHGPLIDSILAYFYSRRMSMDEYENIYLDDIHQAKQEEGIKVYSGLEIEYFPEMDDYYKKFLRELDFLILGQHYYWLNDHYHNIYDPQSHESIKAYEESVVNGIKTGYFKIVAHPDIYCVKYGVWDDECEKVAQSIIQTAMEHNVLLELNANGVRNCIRKKISYITTDGHLSYGYPKYEFWKLVKKMNAKVIINDDAHFFRCLNDDATKEVYKLAEELGLNVVSRLE